MRFNKESDIIEIKRTGKMECYKYIGYTYLRKTIKEEIIKRIRSEWSCYDKYREIRVNKK